MINKTQAVAVEVLSPDNQTITRDFDAFIKLDTQSKVFATKASAALILSGVELKRLHEIYGVRAGNPSNSRTRAVIGSTWPQIVKQYGGISPDTANRRIRLAEGAAKELPILREVLDGDIDFRLLSPAKKEALERGLHVLTDGRNQRQLMWDFGLVPEAKLRGGDRSLSDKKEIKNWCKEYHPEIPAAQCELLPGKLKKEFRIWSANQQTDEPDYTKIVENSIDTIFGQIGFEACYNGCRVSSLNDWIEAAEKLVRTLKEAKSNRHTPVQ